MVGATLSIDARTLKTLIIHISARVNLIQDLSSFFHFYSIIMHILQTKLNRLKISSKKHHLSLILIISYKRSHIRDFLLYPI